MVIAGSGKWINFFRHMIWLFKTVIIPDVKKSQRGSPPILTCLLSERSLILAATDGFAMKLTPEKLATAGCVFVGAVWLWFKVIGA